MSSFLEQSNTETTLTFFLKYKNPSLHLQVIKECIIAADNM